MIEMIRADREKDISSYRKAGKACLGSIDQIKERRLGEILGERDDLLEGGLDLDELGVRRVRL